MWITLPAFCVIIKRMYFFSFIPLLILFILFAMVISLRSRVGRLERRLSSESFSSEKVSGPENISYSPPLDAEEKTSLKIEATPSSKAGPTAGELFAAWLKDDWLLKLGGFLLLIGFGWLATYAFLHNWIGPIGRITLGIVAGAAFIALGFWRIKKFLHQGGIFLALGSTIVLLTVFAAREIYGFFSPVSALGIMFLSTAFVALASVKYESRALALASVVLAGIAPLLTNPPNDFVALFAYLFVVTLGTLWVVALTGYRELTLASLITTALYSAPYFIGFMSKDEATLLLFAYAFSAIFFITNTLGILKQKEKQISADLITAGGTGIFLLLWVLTAAKDEWQSLILAAWTLIFILGAFTTFKMSGRREPLFVYGCVGVGLLAAATAAELEGQALVIAYTIEAGLLSFAAFALTRDTRAAEVASMTLIVPIIMSLPSIAAREWSSAIFHGHFFVLFILALTLVALGVFFSVMKLKHANGERSETPLWLIIAGSIYCYIIIWLSLHAALKSDDTAVMFSLLIYTIFGLVTYFRGRTADSKGLRYYGGTLLLFVVGRLLLVDVWQMDITGKIITFFAVGALLLSTAFIGRKKNNLGASQL